MKTLLNLLLTKTLRAWKWTRINWLLLFVSGGTVGIFVLDTAAAYVCTAVTRDVDRQSSSKVFSELKYGKRNFKLNTSNVTFCAFLAIFSRGTFYVEVQKKFDNTGPERMKDKGKKVSSAVRRCAVELGLYRAQFNISRATGHHATHRLSWHLAVQRVSIFTVWILWLLWKPQLKMAAEHKCSSPASTK